MGWSAETATLMRELAIDPQRDYQPVEPPCGRLKRGHHDVRQVATITCDITPAGS